MAIPVVASWTEQNNVAGSPTQTLAIAEPSGLAVDDWCLILVADDDNTDTAQYDDSTNKPTGFTLVQTGGTSARDAQYAIFKRKITGAESWPITLTANTQDDTVAWALRITGANATDCIDSIGSGGDLATSSTQTIPQITTTQDDCLAMYLIATDGEDTLSHSVSGTGWSQTDDGGVGVSGNGVGGSWGTKSMSSAGATVDATVTLAVSDGASGVQFAIAPAAASGFMFGGIAGEGGLAGRGGLAGKGGGLTG